MFILQLINKQKEGQFRMSKPIYLFNGLNTDPIENLISGINFPSTQRISKSRKVSDPYKTFF